ncbi:MAG: methyltransferase domain-containing protein [Anaerolineales bacterium]|jgi:ubiquinone/menaquinone biosynthesis C-methylase UbiE
MTEQPLEERVYFFDRQEIVVPDFPAQGRILDIGGGGEGVIGLLKGLQAVAIDLNQSELQEAPEGASKVVMDARQLGFPADSFGAATAFFALMYLDSRETIQQVFAETFRTLTPGGRFLIWDLQVQERQDVPQDIYAIRLSIQVAGKRVETGYGQLWPRRPRNAALYTDLAKASGFALDDQWQDGRVFFLRLRKPAA